MLETHFHEGRWHRVEAYCIYLRKSRADVELEARGEGETLKRHEKTLLDLAEKMNIVIGKIYKEIVSGENIESRPVVQEVLSDVESEMWAGVLVMEVERLARGDTMDQGRVAKSFKYSNTKIITPMKIYNPSNEFDEEYFEFGLFMSRREYKTINRRLQNGRVTSVNDGKFVGSIAPFGYDKEKANDGKGFTLVKNQNSDTIKFIFELYANQAFSLNDIVLKLNEMNIKPMKNNEWVVSSLKDILSNPVYIGKVRWNSRREVKIYKDNKIKKTRPRNKDIILKDGLHEAIIETELWDKVQERRKNNFVPLTHNNVVKNPLMGLVFCGKCGKTMSRRPYNKAGKDASLICQNPKCDNISSKLFIVEEQILVAVKNWLKSFKVPKEELLKSNKMIDNRIKELKDVVDMLNRKLEKEESKISNIYSFFEEGTYTKEVFKERLQSAEIEKQKITLNIEEYNKEIEKQNELINQSDVIIPKIENVIELYDILETAEEKNDLLKTIISKVIYLKTTKAIKKNSDPTDFDLKIFPKI